METALPRKHCMSRWIRNVFLFPQPSPYLWVSPSLRLLSPLPTDFLPLWQAGCCQPESLPPVKVPWKRKGHPSKTSEEKEEWLPFSRAEVLILNEKEWKKFATGFLENNDAVSPKGKRGEGREAKWGGGEIIKRHIGDKREQETRLIFSVWYQCNRAVTLAIEATPRWKEESEGRQKKRRGRRATDWGQSRQWQRRMALLMSVYKWKRGGNHSRSPGADERWKIQGRTSAALGGSGGEGLDPRVSLWTLPCAR